jgi:hypothetical protein
MKHTLLVLFSVLTLSNAPALAENIESVQKPLWSCSLTFEADGGGVQFLLGAFKLTGPGKIRCMDIAGNHEDMDVKVTMGSGPIAPNFAIGHFELAGFATGIGVAKGPQSLLGKYYTAGGQAAVVVGVGANIALHGGHDALNLNLGVNVLKGLGLQVGFNKVKIEALN